MNLRNATVIGFFSLPSASLAEHNPSAYNAAMAAAPANAGTCAHCGTGITHHVVVRDEAGETRFIGTQCAERVGGEVALCVRGKMTSEARAKQEAERERKNAEWRAEQEKHEAIRAERRERFAGILASLREYQTEFHASLADQLEVRPLSYRQADYALRAHFCGRRTKKNAAAWDALADAIVGEEVMNTFRA